jgi:uncharacterized protein (TIGR02611 family)
LIRNTQPIYSRLRYDLQMSNGPGFRIRIRENTERLRRGKSGSGFLDCFHYKQELNRKHGALFRKIDILLGSSLVLVGLIMIPRPGPGWVVVFVGMALLAGESEKVAKFMDQAEVFARKVKTKIKRDWRKCSATVRMSIIMVSGTLMFGFAYFIYTIWKASSVR